MRASTRLWLGPAVSFALVAPVQFAAVTAARVAEPVIALILFLVPAAIVVAIFALVARWRWTVAAVRWTAVLLLGALLLAACGLLAYAVLGEQTPLGRGLMLGITLFLDSAILLPTAVVVIVHWLALRAPPAPVGPPEATRHAGA
ncbi:hypothetical protein [Rhodoplanes roseus]|uniref:Uncharacterized protein n=1 Tax=Rhodoplanes roseus TaxID=29409 RepID=A0A327KY31_9BRAD|nr:hypothetical protein [Rhodoplanes roseus]RAI42944.1 hypothetical protein CH341_16895 [Rhodoplanes roseus]